MEVTAWVCDAQSGNVQGSLPLAPGGRFAARFGGGAFTAQVPLGELRTRDGRGPDTGAIQRILDWCDGGKYSLLLTAGTTVLGEWLIWQHAPATATGLLPISGFEWDGYPKFRSLNDNYIYKNADLGTMARALLQDAFSSYQFTQITVPAFTAGRTGQIDYKSHTAYYGDVLAKVEQMGLEWRVNVTAQWSGGVPAKAVRTVAFGAPEVRRTTTARINAGPPDRRTGNAVSFERSRDFSKYAQSMYGWGGGEGAKQRWVGLSDPTLTNQGYLIVTKNETYPGEVAVPALTRLTQQSLDAAQELWEPTQATVDADRMAAWPRPGDVIPCSVEWAWSYPTGYSGSLRVGEVSFSTGRGSLVDLQLA